MTESEIAERVQRALQAYELENGERLHPFDPDFVKILRRLLRDDAKP